jgi:hypothetical protein
VVEFTPLHPVDFGGTRFGSLGLLGSEKQAQRNGAGQGYLQRSAIHRGFRSFSQSSDWSGGSANIESDGSFRLPEPIEVGTYIVYLAPKMENDPTAEPKPVSIDKSIPEKYWSESTSDIRVEVQKGSNEFTIELKP